MPKKSASILLDTPQKLMRAIAQVFEDYPNVHTKGTIARNQFGHETAVFDEKAVKFCAVGAMCRLRLEGSTTQEVVDMAYEACGGAHRIWAENDDGGRKEIIRMLRETADKLDKKGVPA